jgi:hypothetical protein
MVEAKGHRGADEVGWEQVVEAPTFDTERTTTLSTSVTKNT